MVDDSNLADYDDPLWYDAENADFEPDGPFLLVLAQQLGGPVLELGCGTGRVTIPLAQQGVNITSVDVVPVMLARARQKAGTLAIQWLAADVRCFHLNRQYDLIFATGGLFQHMLTRADQEALLAQVYKHLEPDGFFAFNAFFPHPRNMTTVSSEEVWFSYRAADGRNVQVSETEHYDHLRQIEHETAIRRWQDAGGTEMVRSARLALRYTFPQEMELLLHYNGLAVEQRLGDWHGNPLTEESMIMVFVCRKEGRKG